MRDPATTRASRLLAAGSAIVLLALAACSTSAAEPEPEIDEIAVVRNVTEIVLPLDAYLLNTRDYATVQVAAHRLIQQCVRRFGGDYTLAEESAIAGLPNLDHPNRLRYGLTDPDSAAVRGYNPPQDLVPKEPDHDWDPSDTELFLVRGATGDFAGRDLPTDTTGSRLPADGCIGEANRTLDGGIARPSDDQLADRLSLESYDRSQKDSRVAAVMAEWTSCMAARGYSYVSSRDPNNRVWPEPPDQEEIATASADVTCKREVKLVEIWYTVETAYQKRMVDQNAESLQLIRAYNESKKRNAARVGS